MEPAVLRRRGTGSSIRSGNHRQNEAAVPSEFYPGGVTVKLISRQEHVGHHVGLRVAGAEEREALPMVVPQQVLKVARPRDDHPAGARHRRREEY